MAEALERVRAQRRLRGILDAAGVAVASLDAEGRVAASNHAFAEVWQRRADDLVGRHLIGVCSDADRAELLAALVRTVEGASEIEQCALTVTGRTGVGRPQRLTLGRIADSTGRTTEVVAVVTDDPGAHAGTVVDDPADGQAPQALGALAQPVDWAIRLSARSGRPFALLRVDPGAEVRAHQDVLVAFADRLGPQLRPSDRTEAIAPLGVFVLASDLGDLQDAAGIAYRVLSSAVEPLHEAGHEGQIVPTIGVVVADGGCAASRLLPASAAALAEAHADGIGAFRIVDLRTGLAA